MSSETVLEIEKHLGDSISKKIFINRIRYNKGEARAIESIIDTVYGGKELLEFMNRFCDNLYIFGAGILGKEFYETFGGCGYCFKGFIDNDERNQNTTICDMSVYSLDKVPRDDRTGIILVNKFHSDVILEQLLERGYLQEQIFVFSKFYLELNHRQYFDVECLDKEQQISFVDCGALDGNTSIWATEWFNQIHKIWVFEPDTRNAKECKENLKNIESEVSVIEKAVYSSNTELYFKESNNGMSSIDSSGEVCVKTATLDSVIEDRGDLYIKMDIEGAEIEALRGAERLIRNCKPKLAICIYHKDEDVIKIPEMLLKYNEDYKFYIRHYSLTKNETVLYAI